MRWRLICVVAIACALAVTIHPTGAFGLASTSRSVSANVVATSAAYNSLTIVQCEGNSLTSSTCSSNLVTNKGTVDAETFRITEDTDPNNKVSQYGIAGGTKVSSGATAWSGGINIGSSAAFNLDLVACGTATGCISTKFYFTNWTVEGQKSGSLDFTATKVMIVVHYP